MPPANDAFSSATVISGTFVNGTGNFYQATTEAGEPALDPSAAGGVGTVWYKYTPATPGVLSFTVSGTVAHVVELHTGDSLVELALQDLETSGAVTAPVANGVPVYVRVYPQNVPASSAPFNYNLTFSAQANALAVTVVEQCPQTPGCVVVHVANLAPGDTVYFDVDNSGSPYLTEDVPDDTTASPDWVRAEDIDEQLMFVSIPMDETTGKGSHVLSVTSDLSGSAIVPFTVEQDPLVDIEEDDEDLAGVSSVLNKWVFRDPLTNYVYEWEANPSSTGSPFAPKTITEDHTTANDGQVLEWEGAPKLGVWELRGTLLTQTQLEAFQHFADLQYRFWVIDDHQKGWVVTIETLDAQPRTKGTAQYPWIHDWTMELRVWRGPVDMT